MIALFIGVVVMLLFVWRRPACVLDVHARLRPDWLGFIAAGWNASGAIGLPAQAVKTVLVPDDQTAADRSSDLYRKIEAFNVWFTIRSNPFIGVGFGKKFYRPISLPNISFFEFWEYLPHNSVLWIWLKTGFFGFAAMLFLFARAMQRGTRSAILVRPSTTRQWSSPGSRTR